MKFEVLQNAVVFRNVFPELTSFIENQKEKNLFDSGITSGNNSAYN